MVDSVDDLKSSRSIAGEDFPNFLNKIIQNFHFKKKVSLEEQKAQKDDRFLRGRQIAYMIYYYFRVTGAHDPVLDYDNLLSSLCSQRQCWRLRYEMGWNSIAYDQDPIWWCPGKSVQIQNTWVWSTQKCAGIVRHGNSSGDTMPNNQKSKTMVTRSADQKLRLRNFDAVREQTNAVFRRESHDRAKATPKTAPPTESPTKEVEVRRENEEPQTQKPAWEDQSTAVQKTSCKVSCQSPATSFQRILRTTSCYNHSWSQTWTIYAAVHILQSTRNVQESPSQQKWLQEHSGQMEFRWQIPQVFVKYRVEWGKHNAARQNCIRRPFLHCDKRRKKLAREVMETLIERRRCTRTIESAQWFYGSEADMQKTVWRTYSNHWRWKQTYPSWTTSQATALSTIWRPWRTRT